MPDPPVEVHWYNLASWVLQFMPLVKAHAYVRTRRQLNAYIKKAARPRKDEPLS